MTAAWREKAIRRENERRQSQLARTVCSCGGFEHVGPSGEGHRAFVEHMRASHPERVPALTRRRGRQGRSN